MSWRQVSADSAEYIVFLYIARGMFYIRTKGNKVYSFPVKIIASSPLYKPLRWQKELPTSSFSFVCLLTSENEKRSPNKTSASPTIWKLFHISGAAKVTITEATSMLQPPRGGRGFCQELRPLSANLQSRTTNAIQSPNPPSSLFKWGGVAVCAILSN